MGEGLGLQRPHRRLGRRPSDLQVIAAEESEREGISLNQFVNNSLAFVVGQKLAH